jgi:predicted lipase
MSADDHRVSFDVCRQMFALSMCVYYYGEMLPAIVQQPLCEFISQSSNELNTLPEHVSKAITFLNEHTPRALVYDYMDDDSTGLQCAITISHATKRITLVFRGSEELTDWYQDSLICKTLVQDVGEVHTGFYNILSSPKYKAFVKRYIAIAKKHPLYTLYLTGHSLGGALATLAACLIVHNTPIQQRPLYTISFGSPRVGDKVWKKTFDTHPLLHHRRVAFEKDIVTSLPFIQYYHTGYEVHLNRAGRVLVSGGDTYKNNSIMRHSISDHKCENYASVMLDNQIISETR